MARADDIELAAIEVGETQVFRREGGQWRVVHRHGSFMAQDETLNAMTEPCEASAHASRSGPGPARRGRSWSR